jgi:cytochrome c oxidase subunit 1
LFWFYSHPAVYIMILPAMGMVSDMISCFARKPLFGYKPMVYSIGGIAGLGFIVWGHHMFVSGMNPALGMTFMVSTMLIALPSAIKTFNWLGTIWGGKLQFTTPMLFSLSFVSMFIIGGLSGIFMAATPVDIFIHDTYFIVAHFHYVLFSGTAMGVLGAIYFWFPKMFGRTMNDSWGKVHFFFTFVLLNCVFYPMHILGMRGFPRRLADPYHYETFQNLLPLNQFITWCAILLVSVQAIFILNFFFSIFFGPRCGRNPWHANGLEWAAPSPPGHGNFDFQPIIYRGPYEYGSPETDEDYYPQTQPPTGRVVAAPAH